MGRLVIFILLLLFAGCEKGTGNFILKGKISDLTFNQNLDGALVKLYKVPVGTTNEILVDSLITQNDGNYYFKFPRERMEKYILRAEKKNYFEIDNPIFYSALNLSEDNILNFETHAKGWVKIRLFNQNPSVGDQLRYIKQAGLQGCPSCCPNTEQNYYGPLDLTFTCVNRGNQTYSFYYWVVNSSNQGLKEIVTTAFDTVNLSLIY
jgi:hypothetical protein